MSAAELMLYDFVLCDNKVFRVCSIEGVMVLLSFREGSKYTVEDNIEPIPLTPDILVKNGFKSYNNSSYQLRGVGVYISWRNVGRLNISFGCAPITSVHIKCKYVHQLQHALKLCRIEKEITL